MASGKPSSAVTSAAISGLAIRLTPRAALARRNSCTAGLVWGSAKGSGSARGGSSSSCSEESPSLTRLVTTMRSSAESSSQRESTTAASGIAFSRACSTSTVGMAARAAATPSTGSVPSGSWRPMARATSAQRPAASVRVASSRSIQRNSV